MIHTYTAKGSCRYRYYVCSHAQQYGCQKCGTRSLPAAEFERYVCGEIRSNLNGDQGRLTQAELATLVERIEYDGRLGELEIQFQSTGEAKGTR